MKTNFIGNWITLLLLLLFSFQSSRASGNSSDKAFNPSELIMHHVLDAHEWHLFSYTNSQNEEKHFTIPLPIILIDNGLQVFSSGEFHNPIHTAKKNSNFYTLHHNHIYKTNALGEINFGEGGKITNAKPFDISITKNVAGLLLGIISGLLILLSVARSYRKNPRAPKGIAGFIEPVILFIRDDVVRPNIGEKHYKRFLPYILSLFFFIWVLNLFGLIPFLNAANVTGNIAITMVLAVITLLITNLNGNKNYWKHIFWMPGVPWPMKIFLAPIELIGVIAKPFALMIRLFANITAGHVLVLSLICLIFIAKTAWVGLGSVPFAIFIMLIEILVTALQAYIFALLTSLYIGMALEEAHH